MACSTSAPEGPIFSIVQGLRRRASVHPERVAITGAGQSVTYGELWHRVVVSAAKLAQYRILAGERVMIAAASTPAFASAYLATHLLGGVAVPVDAGAPVARHAEIARRSRPRLGIGLSPEMDPGVPTLNLEALEIADGNGERFVEPVIERSEGALADLLFTTGTTGFPKGVPLSHANLMAAASHINSVIGNGEGDVEVVPLPLSHSFGLGRLRCNLLAGGTLVLAPGFKLPGEIFGALRTSKATGLVGVPAGLAVLLRFGARGLGSFAEQLRYVEIGSAPMPLEHKQSLMQLLPETRLFMHYGLTEASRSCFLEFHRHHDKLLTVGRPAPGIEVQVRDERGVPLPVGGRGSLWIRGPHAAAAYWEEPQRSAQVFVDGWVCTDDIAELSADGFVTLHGRRDDMINVGGFNVSPDEVERILEGHSAVSEAACIGVADPRGIAGQIVRAYLVLKPGEARPEEAELQRWTAERLEAYKVPIEYDWLPALPRTPSGKLQRNVLRAAAGTP